MMKFCVRILFLLFVCAIFSPHIVYGAPQQYPPAPVDKILKKQFISDDSLQKYQKSIIRSYSLTPEQLNRLLETEYSKINNETQRMQKIKQNWRSFPYAYRFANYKLNEQISDEITQSRKKFGNRKQRFNELMKNTTANQKIYIIEATDPLFFFKTVRSSGNSKAGRIQLSYSMHAIYYLSVFDHEYKHQFTYHRQHVDMLQQRRIITTLNTKNKRVNSAFQKLFDDYLSDMKRIGSGLDINNQEMFAKLNEMRNEYRSE